MRNDSHSGQPLRVNPIEARWKTNVPGDSRYKGVMRRASGGLGL
jgi:hypothetical protein